MDTVKKLYLPLLLLIFFQQSVYNQTELTFGKQKIKIPGNEICSFTINKNSHYERCFLKIENQNLWYTVVEFDNGNPVHIEITECNLSELDKSSCSLGVSDLKATFTPGQMEVIYLYTTKDQANISTTVYPSPDVPAIIEKASVGRIYFRDHNKAEICFNTHFK
jgi:hypothetical protein